MKKFKLSFLTVLVAAFVTIAFIGCTKDTMEPGLSSDAKPTPNVENCTGYTVTAVATHPTLTTTEIVWTITNPNPGNGSGKTLQDLSHWNFAPPACLDENWQDVISTSYRFGTSGDFIDLGNPDIKPDPSIRTCSEDDVVKFDIGTNGSTPTQYKITLQGLYEVGGDLTVYFKSGNNTGCCKTTKVGVGITCAPVSECSLSQGYWFANNSMHPMGVHPWSTTVQIGGKTYSNEDGLAIWNASNKGGIRDSKRAFTQLAAIKLSGIDVAAAGLTSAVKTIEDWLGSISKLNGTAGTAFYLPNQTSDEISRFGNASAAASAISAWINGNHCP